MTPINIAQLKTSAVVSIVDAAEVKNYEDARVAGCLATIPEI